MHTDHEIAPFDMYEAKLPYTNSLGDSGTIYLTDKEDVLRARWSHLMGDENVFDQVQGVMTADLARNTRFAYGNTRLHSDIIGGLAANQRPFDPKVFFEHKFSPHMKESSLTFTGESLSDLEDCIRAILACVPDLDPQTILRIGIGTHHYVQTTFADFDIKKIELDKKIIEGLVNWDKHEKAIIDYTNSRIATGGSHPEAAARLGNALLRRTFRVDRGGDNPKDLVLFGDMSANPHDEDNVRKSARLLIESGVPEDVKVHLLSMRVSNALNHRTLKQWVDDERN